MVTKRTNLVGIAVDHSGNVYLTSSGSGNLHKETLQMDGSYIETSIGYGIATPGELAVDGSGNIFILSTKDNRLYAEKVQPDGSYLQSSFALGIASPESIAVDGNGNLYIADPSNGAIDEVAPQKNGSFVENINSYALTGISGIAVDRRGNIFYSRVPQGTSSGQVDMIDIADPPRLSFAKTAVGVESTPQYVTVLNAGNAPLAFPVPVSGSNPNITAGTTLNGDSTCPVVGASGVAGSLAQGSSCNYGISFLPATRGSTGEVLLTDTSLNAAGPGYAQQHIVLSGSGTNSDATRTTMRVSPNPVKVGLGVTMTVTVTDTSTSNTVTQGGVTFIDSVGDQSVSLNGGAAVAISNGKATITMIPKVAGAHTVTAHYGGVDDSFLGSTAKEGLTVQP